MQIHLITHQGAAAVSRQQVHLICQWRIHLQQLQTLTSRVLRDATRLCLHLPISMALLTPFWMATIPHHLSLAPLCHILLQHLPQCFQHRCTPHMTTPHLLPSLAACLHWVCPCGGKLISTDHEVLSTDCKGFYNYNIVYVLCNAWLDHIIYM